MFGGETFSEKQDGARLRTQFDKVASVMRDGKWHTLDELFCDTETFSTVPITHGSHAYAEGAEVMLFLYAFGDGPTKCWDVTTGEPMPDDLRGALDDPKQMTVWHNGGMFDTVVLLHALSIDLPIERVHDTMVQAYAHALPGSLGQLCEVLKVPSDAAKSKEGKRLIQLFCKPQKFTHRLERNFNGGETLAEFKLRVQTARDNWVGRATRLTHPVEWAEFIEYGKADITAMRECKKRMPNWNYKGAELALWHLDQKINRRGMFMDLDLARGALAAVAQAQIELAERTVVATDGQVASATQRNAMLDHIASQYGIVLSDLQMSTVDRMYDDPDTPAGLRLLLEIRLQASTTSTSKYKTIMNAVSRDGRLRGTMQFDGASRTGRVGHRLMQPGNMPRPALKQHEIDSGIVAIKAGCADLVVDNVMQLTSSAIRSTIAAPPGKKLVVADLSNIEGRVLAWLAGEEWKLQAFRDFDNGVGHDLYKLAYGKSFSVPPESVTKDQRQIGKVQELALGFASGVNGIATFAAAYAIDLDDLASKVLPVAPGWAVDEAESFYDWMLKKGEANITMSRDAFVACDAIKRVWRQAHPMTVNLWAELESACKEAIDNPGVTLTYRKLKVRRDGAWLRIALPSGRAICYPSPQIVAGAVTYMGVHQFSRKWVRITTYGGKLVENCIAGGTPVLTDRGWVPIELVTAQHRVWDGAMWVSHRGLAAKGPQPVINVFGVNMTPDHKVLTNRGWVNASSCEGHNRAPCGLPDSGALLGVGRGEVYLGGEVRLRRGGPHGCNRIGEAGQARDIGVMRVQAQGVNRAAKHNARNVAPPGIRGLAQHVRQVLSAHTSGVAKLWRARHSGLSALAGVFRELLGGHGGGVPARAGDRQAQQRRGLLTGELPLGDFQDAGQQHPQEQAGHGQDCGATVRGIGDRPHNAAVPHSGWSPCKQASGSARHYAQVYDLIDCGPRRRFVVRGADGQPLIVHNCTQAAARDVLFSSMPAIDDAGYAIILSIHDELLTETPDAPEYSHESLAGMMATPPPWAEDMPLAAAGFECYSYRKG